MNPAALLRRPIVVVGVIVAILAAAFVYAGDVTGFNTEGGDGVAGSIRYQIKFTDTKYINTWTTDGVSEDITVQGLYQNTAVVLPSVINWYRYHLLIEGEEYATSPTYAASGQVGPIVIPGGWTPGIAWTTTVEGGESGLLAARMVVRMEIRVATFPTGFVQEDEAWDGAYLKSGLSYCQLADPLTTTYQEGGSARVYVKTGFSNNGVWALKLYPPADRADLPTVVINAAIPDDTEKYYTVPIQAGYFEVGSSNEYRVELWNDYFDDGFCDFISVDSLDRIPTNLRGNIDHSGITVTVDVQADSTYRPISKFTYDAWYGSLTKPSLSDTEDWIRYNQDVAAEQDGKVTYDGEFSFDIKPELDGMIQIQVVAYDDEGRASQAEYFQVKVVNGALDDSWNNDPGQPFIWSNAVYALLIVGVILGLVAALAWRGRLGTRAAIALAIMAMFGFAAWVVGSDPSLAFILG